MTIPSKPSALKRLRQSEKRRRRNARRKAELRSVIKQIQAHLATGEREQAQALLSQLMKAADKAASHGAIHPNRAARLKSRLTRRVNAAS